MNEAERTDVQILIRAAIDYVQRCEGNWKVEREESQDLRDRISDVLQHVYAR